jgi:raffinose/stachyose/melibiose transport system substrate-binding protein
MNRRTKFAAAAVAAAFVVGLAGCSNPVAGGSDSGNGDAAPAKSITIWHNTADSPALLNLYKNFTKATGIKVDLVDIPSSSFETTTQTKWTTGDKPDVMEYHPTAAAILQFNPTNFQDLSSEAFVKKSGDLYKSAGSYDGKVYAAVTQLPSIFGIYYNKADLKKAGVDVPKNWDDLLSACKALNAVGITPIYESGNSQWPTQILPAAYVADSNKANEYGQALFENKEKVNDPNGAMVKGIEAYKSLQDAGCFQKDFATGTFEKSTDAVYTGSAAMTALHSDALTQFEQTAGSAEKVSEAVGFTGVSAKNATAWYGPSPLGSYYAPKTGDKSRQAAALKFIQYATGDGYAKLIEEGKTYPVIEGVADPTGLAPIQKEFKDAYDNGATVGVNLPGWNTFPAELSKLLNGQETAQQVADNMEASVQQAAKAASLPGW